MDLGLSRENGNRTRFPIEREFREFLDRLRHAKDKAEFDQFMTERRNRPPETSRPPEPQPQPH